MRPRLPGLTSLRFFAASMIVLLHADDSFGLPSVGRLISLGGGVSFFFVLSGFILTYVYPELPTGRAKIRFLLARFARIWPAHVVGIVAAIAVTSDIAGGLYLPPNWKMATNLTMIQAWAPLDWFNNSINPPSWSISTEFAFYLLFPLLIANFNQTSRGKLGISVAAAALMIGFAAWLGVPYGNADGGLSGQGFVYMNPLARLFEFVIGMCAALLWIRYHHQVRIGYAAATGLEMLAIALVFYNLVQMTGHANNGYMPLLSWFDNAGSNTIPVAFLILIVATQRGAVGRALSRDLFVLFGEISYSVYLLHLPLLGLYQAHKTQLAFCPDWLRGIGFTMVLLLVSYLVWRFIERPMRKLLTGGHALAMREMDGGRPAVAKQ